MAEGNSKGKDTRQRIEELHALGKQPKEIARELGLKKQLVSYHIKQIRFQQEKKKSASKPRGRKIEWSVYHEQRVMRGECLFDFDFLADEKNRLAQMNACKRGRKFQYSNFMVEFAFSVKTAFKISYAMLEGVLRKILPLLGLVAPDYSTVCKRVEELSNNIVTFGVPSEKGSEDAIDSTGRSQNLRGSYRESKYDIEARKFLKLSVEVDTENLEVKAFIVSEPNVADIKHSPKLVEESQKYGKINKIYEDRGYDSATHRTELIGKGIEPVIRPRMYGDLQENKERLEMLVMKVQTSSSEMERKKLLGKIHRLKAVVDCAIDYEKWRDTNGYGKRAMVENFFSRDTLIFGDRVCSKKIDKARVEMAIRISLLNAFITLRKCSSKAEANSVKTCLTERLRERNAG